MKFLLFLATKKGYEYLKGMLEYNKNLIGAVFSFNELNVTENYFPLIEEECFKNGILFFDWIRGKKGLQTLVTEEKINAAILIGWRYLFDDSILELFHGNVVIYHDSLLPRYRGFAPTATAVINGEKEIGFTVVFADKEIDGGQIIYQKRYELRDEYYMKDIVSLLSRGYAESISEVLSNLSNGKFVAQDHSGATYSCWRDLSDMEIDWRRSNKDVYNFIRALGDPYLGAFSYLDGQKIIIKSSEVLDEDVRFEIRYPGKLWKINKDQAVVICGEGLLRIKDCYDDKGNRIAFTSLRKRFVRKGA